MDLWEETLEGEDRNKQVELDDVWNPKCRWERRLQKEKKKKKKAYNKQTKKKWKSTGQENEYSRNNVLDELNFTEEENKPLFQVKEEVQCPEKTSRQTSVKKTTASAAPPLCACAERLKEKIKIICVENKLYYFSRPCYKELDKTKLVQLYRDNVDRNLHGARNVKSFYELYSYLLTDSEIQIKLNPGRLSRLAILKNGIYNLKNGRLEPFDQSVIAFSYVDAAYTENMECPRFERFLCGVTGNNAVLIERLWKFLGYIVTQSLDAKAFFVMGCAPNSGKSLLGKFITKLFDPQYVSSIALSDLNGDFLMGTLVGAAVNVSLDLPGSRLGAAAVSKLKMLTGGDLITINEKYMPQFKYQNRAKFIFASNHPIQLVEDDEAFWERMVFLPFQYSVSKPEQDMDLLKKLLKEKDAIVSKALQYARILMEDNYTFPTTDGIERQIRKWRGIEIDTIQEFLKDKCLLDETCRGETMADLYEAYHSYCRENGEKPQTQTEMKGYLENQIGLQHKKTRLGQGGNPKSAFVGIKLCEKEAIQIRR